MDDVEAATRTQRVSEHYWALVTKKTREQGLSVWLCVREVLVRQWSEELDQSKTELVGCRSVTSTSSTGEGGTVGVGDGVLATGTPGA